jgi:hypothetical protein
LYNRCEGTRYCSFWISGCLDLAKHFNLKISKSQSPKLNFTCLSSFSIPLPAIRLYLTNQQYYEPFVYPCGME